jgi:hypothetical protein
MASLVKNFLIGFFLLAFSTILPHGVMAQAADRDIDAKIKRLEQLEAKVDVKLKKLESLEARLEARLEPEVQPVVARVQDPLASSGNGHGIASAGVTSAATAAVASASAAGSVPGQDKDQWGGQVSFRGGFTLLDSPARSGVFTGGGTNKGGYMAGGALDVPLMRDPWMDNPLLGQISVDFTGVDGKTTFAITGERGKQSLLKIAISPKYRIDNLGEFSPLLQNIRPWIIPIGMAFLLSSPPSDSVAYATIGGTVGAGIEYLLWHRRFSLGLASSYNFFSEDRNRIKTDHFSVGPYVGINF